MRILVIRAEPAATQTAEKIERLGHEPIMFPMSTCHCDPNFKLSNIQPVSGLIITSANALRCISKDIELETEIKNKPIFAVGDTTADLAHSLGFNHIIKANGGGRKLAEHIVKYISNNNEFQLEGAPLAYLTTSQRTRDLEEILTDNNVNFSMSFVYEMKTDFELDALIALLKKQNIDAILFYSKNSVRRFFTQLPPSCYKLFTTTRFGCLSKEIATAVPEEYSEQIAIAIKPDEHHLLASIGCQKRSTPTSIS